MAVPRTAQVQPGAAVSIVLKPDQRTGREVQGVVRDVLTRGDHPRGIKVRLLDGRVGRVQRMDSSAPASAVLSQLQSQLQSQQQPQQDPPEQSAPALQVRSEGGGAERRGGRGLRYRDARLDGELDEPAAQADLLAYARVVPAKKSKGAARAKNSAPEAAQTPPAAAPPLATCPVCGAFEGDEAAVAHHVEGHFE